MLVFRQNLGISRLFSGGLTHSMTRAKSDMWKYQSSTSITTNTCVCDMHGNQQVVVETSWIPPNTQVEHHVIRHISNLPRATMRARRRRTRPRASLFSLSTKLCEVLSRGTNVSDKHMFRCSLHPVRLSCDTPGSTTGTCRRSHLLDFEIKCAIA